jgi:hypothetical protein
MKWDETGIAVCESTRQISRISIAEGAVGSFYRQAIPMDITQDSPDPSNWGPPVAFLDPAYCNISQYFANHSIVFGEKLPPTAH